MNDHLLWMPNFSNTFPMSSIQNSAVKHPPDILVQHLETIHCIPVSLSGRKPSAQPGSPPSPDRRSPPPWWDRTGNRTSRIQAAFHVTRPARLDRLRVGNAFFPGGQNRVPLCEGLLRRRRARHRRAILHMRNSLMRAKKDGDASQPYVTSR